MTRLVRTFVPAAVSLAIAVAAGAEPITTIRNSGSPSNRVDIVIMGDGYTAAEIGAGKFAADVENMVTGLFAQQPYAEYQQYFNVFRIDVTSNQSGADHPSRSVFVDTALGAAYDCGGITRLICVNTSAVNGVLSRTITDPNARDIVIVLVNDLEYGGSGGAVAVASLHRDVVELVLHETGHSFGLLADEYGGPPPPSCNLVEPSQPNSTMVTERASIKWRLWIAPSTPVPTPGTSPGIPGLYQGSSYCDAGMYRPTFNSKMRSLGRPFEQINTEQHVRRIYNLVSPVDALSPATTVVVRTNATQIFTITTPVPATHALSIAWTVDGVPAGSGPSFSLSGSLYATGAHTVGATVTDGTELVRNDPSGLLRAVRTWNVTVMRAIVPLDFDGDDIADRSVFRPSNGFWYTRLGATTQWGLPGDVPLAGDYDGDGALDLAVFRPATGEWWVRNQPGFVWGQAGDIPIPGHYDANGTTDAAVFRTSDSDVATWHVRGVSAFPRTWGVRGDVPVPGDYDGDGSLDPAIYRPRTGQWLINFSSNNYVNNTTVSWGIPGDIPVPGNFDGDGKTDVAIFRPSTGQWYITFAASNFTTYAIHTWGVAGDMPIALDMDGDRVDDLTIYRPSDGTWWTYNRITGGVVSQQWGLPGDIPIGARIPAVHPTDFDGDAIRDISVFRPSTGVWYTFFSSGKPAQGNQWGINGDTIAAGDYDGDRRADFAVFRPSTAEWFLLLSSSNNTAYRHIQWGLPGDVPVQGDYDGDGVTDIAVYRPSEGNWYVLTSSSNFTQYTVNQFGLPGDTPVAADYDGDGRLDLAVFRPSSGTWFIKTSSGLYGGAGGVFTRQLGLSTDVPVPADYDGDGRADIAFYRPSTGLWVAADIATAKTPVNEPWGAAAGDIPITGDFDGDGIAELAVYRPSTGEWIVRKSSGGSFTMAWGEPGDQPVKR